MIEIPLTQGKVALIDDEDAERVLQHRWYAIRYPNRTKTSVLWYAATMIDRHAVKLHRFILLPAPKQMIDHRNGDGLDNQRCNLRYCTRGQNRVNSQKNYSRPGYRGIFWDAKKRRWRARVEENGRGYSFGYCIDAVDAARIYDREAKRVWGEFARLNFPDEAVRR